MIIVSAHLCVRSHYSILNGLMSVDEILSEASKMGYSHIALSELNVMYSALEFYKKSQDYGIQPIFAMEIQFENYKSLVLAKDNKGLITLNRLSYLLSKQDFISLDDIVDDQEHLILILFSEKGPFEQNMNKGDYLLVSNTMEMFRDTFKYVYIGISHQESKFFNTYNEKLVALGEGVGLKSVAVPKVYYRHEEDQEVFKALRAIDLGKTLDDPTLTSEPGRYLLDKETMKHLYGETLLAPIDEIIALINVDFSTIKSGLPKFNTGQDVDNALYLSTLSKVGLKKRLDNEDKQVYNTRLQYELDIINSMKFTDYFLIVYDMIRYAKHKGILVGPGRGSAAGSLVAYSLGITDVDPLEYGLIFERFLNPERLSMPDIDIDIPPNRKDEVIAYLNMKYGKEHVAQILTFDNLLAKSTFKAVGRILNIPLAKVNEATHHIGNNTLIDTYKKNKRFAKMIQSDTRLQACMDLSLKIQGRPRHTSIHAAGIVLSDKPILEVAPMQALDDATNALQYDMTYLESIGLIKIDLLSLRNLATIDRILQKVRLSHPEFRIQDIALDDAATFDLLAKGSTSGIFQLESYGMTNLLMQMKPSHFNDVVATIALYRPGPMENRDIYLKNKAHPKQISYLHPDLKAITQDTFGVLVYQEQIMEVASVFANFTLAKADSLRRGLSSKDGGLLKTLESDFMDGCIMNGYEASLAKDIFALIYKFADYGFNKSHSVAYGLIAYQMAYLKANYAQLFYTELLTSVINDVRRTSIYLEECKKNNVLILPPNLDQSTHTYTLEHHKIRLPLTIIRGISDNLSQKIMAERAMYGPFNSLVDAIVRLVAMGVKKDQIEALISAGALDYFGETREGMHASLERIIMYAQLVSSHDSSGNRVMNYDLLSQPELILAPNNRKERLDKEYEVLGFYLSEHPIMELRSKHETIALENMVVQDSWYRVIASVTSIREIRDKNGNPMAFLNLSDDTDSIDVVLFSSLYSKVKGQLRVGTYVLVMISYKEEGSKIVQKIHIIE